MTIAMSGSRVSVFARLGKHVDPSDTDTCNNYSRKKSWKNADPTHSTNGRKIVNPEDVTVVSSLNRKQSTCSKSVDSTKQSAGCNSKILNHSSSGNSTYPKQRCTGSARLGGSLNQQLQESAPRRLIRRWPVKSDLLEPNMEETVGSTGIEDAQPKQSTCHEVEEDRSVRGNKCASSHGSGLIPLAKLKGHHKTITGIALPCGSSTLYTVSEDNCLRAWDCHTGQCAGTEVLAGIARCMVTKGPWLFAGLPNTVKKTVYSINAIGGQVHSLEFDNDILFAGMEYGSILVWRWNSVANEFEPAASMKGHSGPVHSLGIGVGRGKLYSGSADCIKVWDQTLQCTQTIDGHSKEVTSLVCWDRYLMSSSLDKRLKIWCATDSGSIEMIHKHQEDQGLLAMTIIDQPESRYLLLSLEDKSLRLFDFPSLAEKGRTYLDEASLITQAGIDGLVFTGDAAGDVSIWNLPGVQRPLEE